MESLIEQRVQSDPGADPRLIRISVGVEDIEVWPVRLHVSAGSYLPLDTLLGPQSRFESGLPESGAGNARILLWDS